MNFTLMALIVALLLGIWFFVRRRQAPHSSDSRPAARSGKSNAAYHAVSIKFTSTACRAAREMAERRFLSTAAPKLPLAECNVLECKCRFVHHKDRRASKDRRTPFGPSAFGGSTGRYEIDQRNRPDRRQDDEDIF